MNLIFNSLENIPLQVSLQKEQLRNVFQRSFSLQTSLQVQVVLQRLCKGISIEYQWLTANTVCRFVCRNLKLEQE
jgi:hypothetical protein